MSYPTITAAQLAKIREAFGLSSIQMAKLLNAPHRTYWRWEKGDSRVPGIGVNYLLTLLRYEQVRNEALQTAKGTPHGD